MGGSIQTPRNTNFQKVFSDNYKIIVDQVDTNRKFAPNYRYCISNEYISIEQICLKIWKRRMWGYYKSFRTKKYLYWNHQQINSRNSQEFAFERNTNVLIWTIQKNKLIRTIPLKENKRIGEFRMHDQKIILTQYNSYNLIFVNYITGYIEYHKLQFKIYKHTFQVSAEFKQIIVNFEGSLLTKWDIQSGQLIRLNYINSVISQVFNFRRNKCVLNHTSYSPDGQQIISYQRYRNRQYNTLEIRDSNDLEIIWSQSSQDYVFVKFSNNGQFVITISPISNIKIFCAKTGQLISFFKQMTIIRWTFTWRNEIDFQQLHYIQGINDFDDSIEIFEFIL